jgi:hypothetical protein
MLLAIDLYEDLVDVEIVTVTSVFSLQFSGVKRAELNTPEANRFAADSDSSLD